MSYIDGSTRQHLHELLDEAIARHNRLAQIDRPEVRRQYSPQLFDLVFSQIVAPLAGGALADWFDTEFRAGSTDTPIQFPTPTDPGAAISSTNVDFLCANIDAERTAVHQGLRRAAAFMLQALQALYPPGVAEQLSGALIAIYGGDDNWLGQVDRSRGSRMRDFTRSIFAMLVTQEVAYWQGRKDWALGRAFFEVTGNYPRRHKSIGAGREPAVCTFHIEDLNWAAFERLKQKAEGFSPGCTEIARSAGEAERLSSTLSDGQRAFIERRGRYDPENIKMMWAYIRS